ncbi:MAG TPA: nitrilase-related carbon-nitrogen hydrolase [Streptosporangiaceae bacterium]|nr:nitrilase-related carbon-nitrogen hydrolase [Streptosporangiaceae bacterium]
MALRRFKIALAQMSPALGDLERNIALHEKLGREAASHGAGLVLFPELSLTGYFIKDLVSSVALKTESPELRPLLALSRDVALVVGLVEETPDRRFYNAALYLEGGAIRHVHRKVYLPTYGIFDEQRYLAAGGRVRAFDTALGRMAILICEDMWHPATVGIAAWDGAEILLCPSASPGRGLGQAEPFQNSSTWERVIRAYGDLFTCFVVYANRVGYEDGACFWGGSEVVDPMGASLAKARYLEEDLLVAEVDAGTLRRARIANPLLRDERLDLTLREVERIIRGQAGEGPGG